MVVGWLVFFQWCIFCVRVFCEREAEINSCFFFWSGSGGIYTNTILYNLYIKDCYRTSNPLKKTALFVVCLVFFFKGITIVVSNIHPFMFLMTEVTFSMAAALGMKDLTADYHLFQARDVRNSRVGREFEICRTAKCCVLFLGGREYIGFCAWEILEWCSEVQWDMLLLLD